MDILSVLHILKLSTMIIGVFAIMFSIFGIWTIVVIVRTKVPFAEIPDKNLKLIFNELNLQPGSILYDLGSGNGKILFMAEKFGINAIGYELSPYQYIKSRLKKFLTHSKIQIFRKNFFNEDLSDADAIFLFLVGAVMKKTGSYLKDQLKPGVAIISYGFEIPGWKISKIIDTKPSKTYLYES